MYMYIYIYMYVCIHIVYIYIYVLVCIRMYTIYVQRCCVTIGLHLWPYTSLSRSMLYHVLYVWSVTHHTYVPCLVAIVLVHMCALIHKVWTRPARCTR